ncbi:MAG: glycosyltransferase family 4 protein [Deltaproteobacteria bacterium]
MEDSTTKILFVSFSEEINTGARYAEYIIRQALSQKHEVRFLCPRQDKTLCKILLPLQLLILGYFPLIAHKCYDLVFTSDNFVFADIVYVQPPAGKNVDLKWDEILFDKWSYFWGHCSSLLIQKPLKFLVSKHAHFITNSHFATAVVQRNYGKKASVIYPPVPTYLYKSFERAREDLVVTISGLNPRKNLELIAEMGKRLSGAKFILVGFYNERFVYILESLRAKFATMGLKDNFIYIPSASDKAKVEVLNRAKVYFHPTFYEPFGIGIAEGMAAGCIPVVHNSGGPQEFVPSEWRYEDVEDAASKIHLALNNWDTTKAAEFRSVAMRFGEERFKEEILDFVERQGGRDGKRLNGRLPD